MTASLLQRQRCDLLLRALAVTDPEGEGAALGRSLGVDDGAALLAAARQCSLMPAVCNQVAPQVSHVRERSEVAGGPDFERQIGVYMADFHYRLGRQRLGLDRLVATLNEHGVEPVIAGTARSLALGAEPILYSEGLVLLVEPQYDARTRAGLDAAGFRRVITLDRTRAAGKSSWFHPLYPGSLALDVLGRHRRIDALLPAETLREAARPVMLPGGRARVFSAADALLHDMLTAHLGRNWWSTTLALSDLYGFFVAHRTLPADEGGHLQARLDHGPALAQITAAWQTTAERLFAPQERGAPSPSVPGIDAARWPLRVRVERRARSQ